MSVQLIVKHEAQEQAERIDDWWRAHRPASPDLFEDEWARALELIERHPDIGHRVTRSPVPGLLVVTLQRTRYHLYYVHDEPSAKAIVLAVWSAVRGRRPPLTSPK